MMSFVRAVRFLMVFGTPTELRLLDVSNESFESVSVLILAPSVVVTAKQQTKSNPRKKEELINFNLKLKWERIVKNEIQI